MEIAKGLAKQNNYKGSDEILTDIVKFHIDWQKETNSVEDVGCFTIREIEGVIRAMAQNKNIYDTILTVYAARYQKEMKEKLKKKLKDYNNLRDLKPSPLELPKDFPHCYSNNNLCETVSSVLFSLTNQRHTIIVGENETGITQVARWCAECFSKRMNKEQKNKNYLCLCTKNLQCSDLIGQTKPCPKNNKSKNNEILKFIPGFLVDAIQNGKIVVLDSINEANATVGERLNGLLDKKNCKEEEFFDLPENSEKQRIEIHPNFRMICTCNINNIKDMSPAFVNRFDVIILENQLDQLKDNQIEELISNIIISFDRIPQKKNKITSFEKKNLEEVQFSDDDEDSEQVEENEVIRKEENKEEIIKKEKEFLNIERSFINKIMKKFKILLLKKAMKTDVDNESIEYSHLRTISALNRFCYGIIKLKKIFSTIKYENNKITDDDKINTVFELLFRDDSTKLEISENIKNVLVNELIEENKQKKEKNEKYFFENSEILKILF